jgi:hypothetical protein
LTIEKQSWLIKKTGGEILPINIQNRRRNPPKKQGRRNPPKNKEDYLKWQRFIINRTVTYHSWRERQLL